MRTRHHRHPGVPGLCALLVAALIAVAPAYGAPTVRLNLWGGFPEIGPFYEKMAADYRRNNPSVEISILTHPLRDFERKLAATIPADTAADILEISTYAMQRFIEAGFVPPNPTAQDTFLKGKAYPDAMKIINTYQRKTYGVPFFQGRQVLFWNIKMFQEAGLTRAPQTWDEVIEYCQKLTKKDATGRLTRAGISLRLFGGGSGVGEKWWFWLYPAGGTVIEQRPGGKYRAGYGNQAGRDALKLFVDLVHKYRCDDPTLKRDAEGFALEQAAMFTRESWVIGFVRSNNPGLLYTAALLPKFRRAGTIINPVNFFVTRSARNPDVAWDFVNFILRPENQQQLLEMTGWMPARQDVEYKEQIRKSPQFKAFFEAPEGYEFYWYQPIGPFDEILTKLAARLERAYADKSLVDNPSGIAKAIEDAAKETNDILRREGLLGE
ncbi:MAG: extracellular solute-binding protein [Armatimonadota bacterium]